MRPSYWLKQGGLIPSPLLVIGLVAFTLSPAQAAPPPTLEALQRELAERDAVIADLLRRVEELEQRVSMPQTEPMTAPVSPPKTTPKAPIRPVAAEQPKPPPLRTQSTKKAPPAPGQFEIDEEAVARALERTLVQEGALLLSPGTLQVQPNFAYVRQEAAVPAFLLRESDLVAADETRRDNLETSLTLRLGLPFESQLTFNVPYHYENASSVSRVRFAGVGEQDRDADGFGDLRISLQKGLLREDGWRPDLFASVLWDTDTGQTENGIPLGSGFDEIGVSLTATKTQDPLVFVGGLSYLQPLGENDIRPGEVISLSLGTALAASPETSLRFFLDQSFVAETKVDGREIPGSDQVLSTFSIGASVLLSRRTLLDVKAGIGLTENTPDYSLRISLPIRFDRLIRF